MNALGVCIGIGKHWQDAAALACAQMRKHAGLECVVCDDIPALPGGWNPSWGKSWLFELVPARYDRLLVFDADIVCVADWRDWQAPHPFMAVRELYSDPARENERMAYRIKNYFNGGLFVIDRSQADRLAALRNYGPRYGRWLEQTALNCLFDDHVPMRTQVNWLLEVSTGHLRGALGSGAVNLHLAGQKDPQELMTMMQKIISITHGVGQPMSDPLSDTP